MPKRKKRTKDPFRSLGKTAVGLGGLGVTVGVSAAAAGRAAVGTPAAGAMGGFGQIASGADIATTAVVGGGLLGQVRQLSKKRKKKRRKR